jgi:hypothetical protein
MFSISRPTSWNLDSYRSSRSNSSCLYQRLANSEAPFHEANETASAIAKKECSLDKTSIWSYPRIPDEAPGNKSASSVKTERCRSPNHSLFCAALVAPDWNLFAMHVPHLSPQEESRRQRHRQARAILETYGSSAYKWYRYDTRSESRR